MRECRVVLKLMGGVWEEGRRKGDGKGRMDHHHDGRLTAVVSEEHFQTFATSETECARVLIHFASQSSTEAKAKSVLVLAHLASNPGHDAKPMAEEVPMEFPTNPLPEAIPLRVPEFPNTGHCHWSYDPECRVLLANFKVGENTPQLNMEDERFLLCMMERTDVAVVSEGLCKGLDPSIWGLSFMEERAGDKVFFNFRTFEQNSVTQREIDEHRCRKHTSDKKSNAEVDGEESEVFVTAKEKDGDLAMTLKDYVHYLRKWKCVWRYRGCLVVTF